MEACVENPGHQVLTCKPQLLAWLHDGAPVTPISHFKKKVKYTYFLIKSEVDRKQAN